MKSHDLLAALHINLTDFTAYSWQILQYKNIWVRGTEIVSAQD